MMTTTLAELDQPDSILDRMMNLLVKLRVEVLLTVLLLIVAIITRFYDLESRVMSHDESLHTYYSWRFLEYQDYDHLPMMHGPLQFHLVAFSYFLFGDTDASSRFPAAFLGVVSIALIFFFRKWLGRWGTVFAMALILVSPYILYYQRYVRNESLVVFEALLMFWAIFSYFEKRESKWLYLLSFSLTLHFATKETSFIYALQLMIFLGVFLGVDILKRPWRSVELKILFLVGLAATIIGASLAGYALLSGPSVSLQDPTIPGQPLDPTATGLISQPGGYSRVLTLGTVMSVGGVLIMFILLVWSFGKRLRTEFPALDLLVITVTMTLPLLAGIPAKMLGLEPLASNTSVFKTPTGIIVVLLFIASLAIGILWDWRRWLIAAAIFWGPFIVLYTSLFTNGHGISSGLVSSLEYWIVQHGEERGGQPWYYYLLVQLPIYEFLPVIGSLVATGFGVKRLWLRFSNPKDTGLEGLSRDSTGSMKQGSSSDPIAFPIVPFFGYWGISSLFFYSFAGERMPWLAVHITLPLIVLAGWAFGKWFESKEWGAMYSARGWLVLGLVFVTYVGFIKAFGIYSGPEPPFQGNELETLKNTTAFLAALVVGIGGLVGLYFAIQKIEFRIVVQLGVLVAFGYLFILTARAAFRAAYRDYDQATEYLVYAHSATGVKTVLSQVEEFSIRTSGDLSVQVAYDDDVSWPFTWYLRNYPNRIFYGGNPSRDLNNYPLVIAGDTNWQKVEPLLGRRYFEYEYIRMWWPMQDYFGLTWDRIKQGIFERNMRSALWDIWLNRDYTAYGNVTGKEFSLANWSPSDRMKFFIRKDVAATIWDYGVIAAVTTDMGFEDPYAEKMVVLESDKMIGQTGSGPGQFTSPRSIAFAIDGSIYVADSKNHRIQHFDAGGTFINEWGSYGDSTQGEAPPGTLNEPWGIAIAPDGSVYVADTWNHRIQHFTAEGEFIETFGRFGQGYDADIFWGPRSVEVDTSGRIFVSDTGNKRIAVFDPSGTLVAQFGGTGSGLGQLNEPVGIGIDPQGLVYVADTWNQRVVVFEEYETNQFRFMREWAIDGWWGESLENKPYLAVSSTGSICVTDPEGYRVLCFNEIGEFIKGWGDYGYDFSTFGLPSGIAFSQEGDPWVSDAGNNRLMRFQPGLEPLIE
jgi:uncharacterized protein (TIGR03663 family)